MLNVLPTASSLYQSNILLNRCSCGHCEPMPTAAESMCCREVDAYWALVQQLLPPRDVPCLTPYPPFTLAVVGPLQVAYLAFRQEHGPLQASRAEQFRYTAYRQIVRWANGIIGREIRKAIPACVVAAIRRQYSEEGHAYQGFQCPNLSESENKHT
ncbi:hypothetical protein ACEWY4_006049 [Coilia grayii]|uniref:P2X purinoreceptor 7 intracellular domain-containing protein n=1 Tax=Coilia grayii TaxID=363190 RepID=A0ABD1KCJ3_9TELE